MENNNKQINPFKNNHYDELKMYFGEPLKVNEWITIFQPTIGQIVKFGETRLYTAILPFVCNPTSFRLQLWDMGIDWNKITDYDLFLMLYPNLRQENTNLLFGNFNFASLILHNKCLYNEQMDVVINEEIYFYIAEYIRLMFNQYPKVEKAKGKETKNAIIEEEKQKLKSDLNTENVSILRPLISSMLNHPGFKYKKNELKDVGIVEFMDSVQRIQLYENTTALMYGMYSGMIDTSKINIKYELNWLRDLNNK